MDKSILRSFFVPKLCNQCVYPPCVQVCPVGATYRTEDGVVLVNPDDLHRMPILHPGVPVRRPVPSPRRHAPRTSAPSATTGSPRGLLPACVEVCPTQARIFGDLNAAASPMSRFLRMNKIHVLKPALNTEPKVYYAGLDGEVR